MNCMVRQFSIWFTLCDFVGQYQTACLYKVKGGDECQCIDNLLLCFIKQTKSSAMLYFIGLTHFILELKCNGKTLILLLLDKLLFTWRILTTELYSSTMKRRPKGFVRILQFGISVSVDKFGVTHVRFHILFLRCC